MSGVVCVEEEYHRELTFGGTLDQLHVGVGVQIMNRGFPSLWGSLLLWGWSAVLLSLSVAGSVMSRMMM